MFNGTVQYGTAFMIIITMKATHQYLMTVTHAVSFLPLFHVTDMPLNYTDLDNCSIKAILNAEINISLFLGPNESHSVTCSLSSVSPESESELQEVMIYNDQRIAGSGAPIDYGLNGDNLDWIRRPSVYSTQRDTESIHWFNVLCYHNQVSDWDLPDDQPIRPIMDLPNSSFLPSTEEHSKLRHDYIILVSRTLIKYCKYFKQFSKMVTSHIPHQFSKEMKQQSEVVSYELIMLINSKISSKGSPKQNGINDCQIQIL